MSSLQCCYTESFRTTLHHEWRASSVGDKCPNKAHTDDEESDGLHEEKDIVISFAKQKVITSTKEDIGCNTKLQKMQPDSILKFSYES